MKLFSGTPLSQFSAPSAGKEARGDITRSRAMATPETAAEPASHASKLRIVPIPRLAAGGRWRVEAMRSLSEPMLLWFTKGQGRITIAGSTRGYTANNAVFI
ncbi:MAG: hypothetical protein WBB85_07205, partial [Albidovulum sp.]